MLCSLALSMLLGSIALAGVDGQIAPEASGDQLNSIENRPISAPSAIDIESVISPVATSSTGWLGRSAASLGFVLVLIAAGAWGLKKFSASSDGGSQGQLIEIAARKILGPKQSVCLVRVGARAVLIGVAGDSIRPLMEINDSTELHEALGRESSSRFSAMLSDESDEMSKIPSNSVEPPTDEPNRALKVRDAIRRLRSYAQEVGGGR
jgi:flagellar biosynthetic protein FliO